MNAFKEFLSEYTQTRLANELGIGQAAINHWLKRGRIPAERVPEVARISGLDRNQLRPDLYS